MVVSLPAGIVGTVGIVAILVVVDVVVAVASPATAAGSAKLDAVSVAMPVLFFHLDGHWRRSSEQRRRLQPRRLPSSPGGSSQGSP